MQQTTYYNLPTYEGTDAANLITGYNAAKVTTAGIVYFIPQQAGE